MRNYVQQYSSEKAKKEEKWWVPQKQTVPVYDFSGNMVGQDYVQFRIFNKHTANYAVHQVFTVWEYRMREFREFFPRRKDAPGGKKEWANKGAGRARMKSRWGTLFGKTSISRPHGYDGKKTMKVPKEKHFKAISTVLQSKWKRMRVVDNLENWGEAKYYKFRTMVENVTGVNAGMVDTLVIARNAEGMIDRHWHNIDKRSFKSAMFMAGMLIPRIYFRTPEHIDPGRDGLKRLLTARRVIISREALHDLHAKYGAEDGWCFKNERQIYVDQISKLAKEYPLDREVQYETARILPASCLERQKWAKEMREKQAQEEIA